MGLKEIETPNAMISYFAEQLGPLIEKSEIKQPTYLYWELMRKAGSGNLQRKVFGKISPKLFRWCILPNSY